MKSEPTKLYKVYFTFKERSIYYPIYEWTDLFFLDPKDKMMDAFLALYKRYGEQVEGIRAVVEVK